jgi:hypothetical protein
MPTFDWKCDEGHSGTMFLHNEFHRQHIPQCPREDCWCVVNFLPSFGMGLTYFEEGRGRWIHNMADQPIFITSPAQHKAECKKHGVEPAGARYGEKGCW